MPLINELHISGRVATDPTQQGKGPTKFRLAHGGGGQRKDGTSWPTQFFSVSMWHKSQLEGLAKGRNVEIFGKLRDASYKAKDGSMRSAVEIVADSIVVEPVETTGEPNIHGVVILDSEIPF